MLGENSHGSSGSGRVLSHGHMYVKQLRADLEIERAHSNTQSHLRRPYVFVLQAKGKQGTNPSAALIFCIELGRLGSQGPRFFTETFESAAQ